jgi:starch-binding outer membrane protein, SusD/RagB family
MKRTSYKLLITGCLAALMASYSCSEDFLEKGAIGSISEKVIANKAGAEKLLIGAYSLLDGQGGPVGVPNNWSMGISNWIYSGIASDDAHKGSEFGDQPQMELIESYTHTPANSYFSEKWDALYAGAQRANDVIRILAKVPAGELSEAEATQLKAEAVFLRAVYHFEAAKLWLNVPYVDETVSFEAGNYNVPNPGPIWDKIEADFKFAAANLSPTKGQAGRANSWAAKAFLAKVYMYQDKYAEAKPVLEDVIANGVTAQGAKYALVNYSDNFNPAKKNGPESVFAVQMSVKDGSGGFNGNNGDILNFPGGGPATCCGFHQPSFSLVNSYKTDPNTGLPLLYTFNESDVKNDHGIATSQPFTPYAGTLDARLDWTVGRRGIPYLDWGLHPGQAWIRSQSHSGPYSPIKTIYYQAGKNSQSDNGEGWAPGQVTSNNYTMIRFADVLLWAAEVEVEVGSLARAEEYVNRVRARAANPDGWVKTYLDPSDPLKGFTSTPAANYKVGLYTGQFTAQGKDFARDAVRFERKLELAMEGHRFFDLQRYDNGTGSMAEVLNAYVKHETTVPGFNWVYMKNAKFEKGKNELYPIPQAQIDLSTTGEGPTLKQNPKY